ncbi:MAG TPA: outer membrane beta-barrel protein [Chitinophagaceae bacterium]|nr:outer membrane beta-barrel protein [Chitinophagaceae bacterium]
MRRILVAAGFLFSAMAAVAQTDSAQAPVATPTPPTTKTVINKSNLPRSNDHFLMQLGYTTWQGAPDSIKTGGFPRTFNMYLLFDFPFKTNPHWSVAVGPGIATDNIYFDKGSVDITGTTANLVFRDLSDTSHFKKYKLATTYAEVPVELRFSSKPDDNRRSVKAALGVKVGTLLNAHTKGNTLQTSSGQTLNAYKQKDFNKRYFNKTRLSATARLGYGHFSLFTSYQLTPLFKEGLAPTIRPLTFGLTLSGL